MAIISIQFDMRQSLIIVVFIGVDLTHQLSLSDEILIKDNHIDILPKKNQVTLLVNLKIILDFIKNIFLYYNIHY